MIGWLAIHRKLGDSDLWLSEKFTRGQAWLDLLVLTNFKDGHIRVSGKRIPVLRGQCGYSQEKLATRWKWSRGKVIRFIKELIEDEMITIETDMGSSIITVCNYKELQKKLKLDSTTDSTSNEQETVQVTDSKQYTIEQEQQGKQIKQEGIIPLTPKTSFNHPEVSMPFDIFKRAWGRKGWDGGTAKDVWVELECWDHLQEYLAQLEIWKKSQEWKDQGGKFIPSASKFLKDYLEKDPKVNKSVF